MIEKEESKTAVWAIWLVAFITLLTSLAQLFFKIGSSRLQLDFLALVQNYHLWAGFALYIIGAFGLIIALKHGELSALYPVIALGYVWVSLLSVYFLGETMNPLKWAGVFIVIAGITFIGLGSSTRFKFFWKNYLHERRQQ